MALYLSVSVTSRCIIETSGLSSWVVVMLSGNSLRQTVHIYRASVHQAAKLVAVLLRVASVTASLAEVMAAYRRVYDSRHLQADCEEPGSAPEPYARQSSTGYLYLLASGQFSSVYVL